MHALQAKPVILYSLGIHRDVFLVRTQCNAIPPWLFMHTERFTTARNLMSTSMKHTLEHRNGSHADAARAQPAI